uniref:RRP15-like protein n=1 Tax=Megaselia scalaris TaxID=36166 RepID=T1GZM0_MEGSC
MDSENEAGNAGWANSIAKVLNTSKPQKRKTLVLSRAKKFTSKVTEDKPKYDFEIEGEVKEEKPEVSESTEPV